MTCSTCDGYEFVPNPQDPDGPLLDCPDCRPARFCRAHPTVRILDDHCSRCVREAQRGAELLLAHARAIVDGQRSALA